jgi:hypothetical protein
MTATEIFTLIFGILGTCYIVTGVVVHLVAYWRQILRFFGQLLKFLGYSIAAIAVAAFFLSCAALFVWGVYGILAQFYALPRDSRILMGIFVLLGVIAYQLARRNESDRSRDR